MEEPRVTVNWKSADKPVLMSENRRGSGTGKVSRRGHENSGFEETGSIRPKDFIRMEMETSQALHYSENLTANQGEKVGSCEAFDMVTVSDISKKQLLRDDEVEIEDIKDQPFSPDYQKFRSTLTCNIEKLKLRYSFWPAMIPSHHKKMMIIKYISNQLTPDQAVKNDLLLWDQIPESIQDATIEKAFALSKPPRLNSVLDLHYSIQSDPADSLEEQESILNRQLAAIEAQESSWMSQFNKLVTVKEKEMVKSSSGPREKIEIYKSVEDLLDRQKRAIRIRQDLKAVKIRLAEKAKMIKMAKIKKADVNGHAYNALNESNLVLEQKFETEEIPLSSNLKGSVEPVDLNPEQIVKPKHHRFSVIEPELEDNRTSLTPEINQGPKVESNEYEILRYGPKRDDTPRRGRPRRQETERRKVQIPGKENEVAKYGYKADGTPRLKPGRQIVNSSSSKNRSKSRNPRQSKATILSFNQSMVVPKYGYKSDGSIRRTPGRWGNCYVLNSEIVKMSDAQSEEKLNPTSGSFKVSLSSTHNPENSSITLG